jgi:transposase
MPWKETNVLDQRKLFISRFLQEEDSFTELCEEFGIPRKTGYKWRARYLEKGLEGLADMSRRPKTFRQQTPNEVLFEIIRIRQWKPSWGGRKIRDYLKENAQFEAVPHARTIDRHLKSCGFVTPRPQTWQKALSSEEIVQPKAPNDVWTVDHKGWWTNWSGVTFPPSIIQPATTLFPPLRNFRIPLHDYKYMTHAVLNSCVASDQVVPMPLSAPA